VSINLNPLLVGGLAALAGNSVPNLNLQATPIDIGAQNRGLAAGMLGQQEQEYKIMQLANAIAQQQLQNEGAMSREQLKAAVDIKNNELNNQTSSENNLLTNQVSRANNTDNLGFKYDKLGVDAQNEDRKFGLEKDKFSFDKAYKGKQLSQEDTKILQTEITNKFNRQFQMDGRKIERQRDLFNNFNQLIGQIKSPEEREGAKQILLKVLEKEQLVDSSELSQLAEASPDQLKVYAAMNGKIADIVGKAQQNPAISSLIDKRNIEAQGNANSLLSKLKDNSVKSQQALNVIDNAKQDLVKLKESVGNVTGPVSGLFLDKTNVDAQNLAASLNTLVSFAKEAFNYGGNGFTDKDREFLAKQTGDLTNYDGSLEELLNRTESMYQGAVVSNWIRMYDQYKGGSIENMNSFLESEPEPYIAVRLKDSKRSPGDYDGYIKASTSAQDLASGKYEVVGYKF
jgi:hypothetical protein